MALRFVTLVLIAFLSGCALPLSFAHGTLCEEATRHCNPTEPGYDDCVNRVDCGVQ